MKKKAIVILALCGLTAAVFLSAEKMSHKPQVVTSDTASKASESSAGRLSVEELAFAAKLSDANRKAFIEKLTVEQRELAMVAARSASVANAADEAVAKILEINAIATAQEIADAAVAVADEISPAAEEAAQENSQRD